VVDLEEEFKNSVLKFLKALSYPQAHTIQDKLSENSVTTDMTKYLLQFVLQLLKGGLHVDHLSRLRRIRRISSVVELQAFAFYF